MDLSKDRLRAAYNEAVAKIGANRNGLLNGPLALRALKAPDFVRFKLDTRNDILWTAFLY